MQPGKLVRIPGVPGPVMGEDNERVLRGILGLSAETFDLLIAEGVIA